MRDGNAYMHKRFRCAVVVVLALPVLGLSSSFEAAAHASRPSVAVAAQPVRLLDTRLSVDGGLARRLTPGSSLVLPTPVGLATDISTLVLNVTAVDGAADGWVKVWPCGQIEPDASAVNFEPGRAAANAVTVKVSSAGICFASSVSVDLIADLSGTFRGTADFTSITPKRLLDTRITGNSLRAGTEQSLMVAGNGEVPSAATFVAVNLTVPDTAASGWVVAYPCGSPTNGSTINFVASQTVANLTFVGLGAGQVCLKSNIDTEIVVDTYGWSMGGGGIVVQSPHRLVDTRDAQGWASGAVASGGTIRLSVAGRGGVPNTADGAFLTVTVAGSAGDGYVTVWPCDEPKPVASTINTFKDAYRSNLAFAKLAADGTVCVYYESSNSTPTDLVVDGVGWSAGMVQRSAPDGAGGTTSAPAPVSRKSSGCVFSSLVVVAFCDSFDGAVVNPGTSRSGDLDGSVWGVSRTNTFANPSQGQLNMWFPASIEGCGSTAAVVPSSDVRVCGGRVFEAVTDGGGQSTLAMYPKQPFDIAGRMGTVVFDVSADSEGPHAAWPEFWWTDQPVPAPHGRDSAQAPYARNSFGFTLASDTCGAGGTNVYAMMITRNSLVEQVPFTKTGCVSKGSASGGLNHFEVRMSEGHVEVWASEPGSTDVRQIAVADVSMPMTRGVIWLEDVHYNANKFNDQRTHTFAWDNVGFDGPSPYRDLTFDVPDNNAPVNGGGVNLGYEVGPTAPVSFSINNVAWLQTPTKAYVTLSWFPTDPSVPSVRVNGGAWQDTVWPFDPETFAWRTIAVPIPVDAVRSGTNTIEIRSATGTVVSNINLTLIAASPVP